MTLEFPQSSTNSSAAGWRSWVTLGALLIGLGICRSAGAQVPQPQILRWEIAATIIQIDNPNGVLNDVRLGDPVRGWLSYHPSVVPNANAFSASYTHPATFQVAQMIIDNPRTGGEIEFTGATDSSAYHNVDVYDDFDDDTIVDYIITLDDVVPTPGLEADYPVIAVELKGSPDVLQDLSLPRQLNLADWPYAILAFVDVLGGAAVYAEIYALTPVEVSFAASDFDFDGDVDADDFQIWTANFGTNGYPDADADFDYDADGDDFLAWQRQFESGSPAGSANLPVPEPATLALLIMAALGAHRRSGQLPREPILA